MRTLTAVFAALVFLLLFAATDAGAAETNYWSNPGRFPLHAPTDVVTEQMLREELTTFGLPAFLLDRAVEAMKTPGVVELLREGECFDRMLFKVGGRTRFIDNICVRFGTAGFDRYAERWRITADDGTVYEITDPRVCKNKALKKVTPPPPPPPPPSPPPPRDPCFRININYTRNQGARVNYETARELQSRGLWYTSEAQAMLHPDLRYAFVLVHLDLTEAELADLTSDVCFGYGDETGFHLEVTYCVGACSSGSYPNAAIVNAMRREKGVPLPDREPSGTFRFPLASGTGYLSLPLRYADRYGLYCVETERYRLTLRGFARYRSEFHLDTITAEEGRSSLTRHTAEGDAELLSQDGSSRILYGEHSF